MEAITFVGYAAECMRQHKVDACVLWLGAETESVMEAARSSPSNRQIVIPGVAGSAQRAIGFSKYAINRVFSEPLEAGRVEIIPRHLKCWPTTWPRARKSARVMSISCDAKLAAGIQLEVSFALPTLPHQDEFPVAFRYACRAPRNSLRLGAGLPGKLSSTPAWLRPH